MESYRVKNVPESAFKVGGNILTYVCTPQGEVIHAIPGAVEPEDYLEQLTWARDTYGQMVELCDEEEAEYLRAAHVDRLPIIISYRAGAHRLLSEQAFLPIAELEKPLFESLLNQTYAPDKDIVIREISKRDYDALVASRPRG